MASFFGFLSLFLLGGLTMVGYLFVKQKSMIDVLVKTGNANRDGLAKCRESYVELKAKAEEHLRGLMQNLNNEKTKSAHLGQSLALLQEKIKQWQVIIDAEAEARRVLTDAHTQAERFKNEAVRVLAEAEVKAKGASQQADGIIAQGKRDADDLRSNAKVLLEQANNRAEGILADARKEAAAIAGEAYDVKQNVAKYERQLKAIRNEIDGYGDEYIVPAHSLLDDLAEDVGYSQAGQELKAIRDRLKLMVKDGKAAECDYAEANRRETAIRFVTDAFNGKVDSTLTRVKADNAGKLQQQIKDAFTLVNANGEAFRNARITQDYLDARLAELKWACIAHEIKKEEQEEQRRIKERIREEEKAKREFEKAIKSAAKEEAAMKKAEAKVREEMERVAAEERERFATASAEERELLEKAAEEQRAKYETELAEIRAKMREVEERGQRAVSMAQQTKKGNVYIISNIGSFGEHVYKIGLTRRLDPHERIKELGDSSVPFEFDVHALIEADDAPALEHRLHKHFVLHQVNKVNHRKEFFRCDIAKIREEVEALGLYATWTMAAAAQDYRETLSIERRIEDDPLAKQRWLDRQLELEDSEDGLRTELVGVTVGGDEEDDEP